MQRSLTALKSMQETVESISRSAGGVAAAERTRHLVLAGLVLLVATSFFGLVFNRATVLSYSIGYNLYASERVLLGDVPYRDFDSLYPPGTIYVNVALFKWMGVSLYSAMFGVLVFKIVAVLFLYLCGLELMPRSWALLATMMSLLWLRPNGAFKSVPMQYGASLLALALYLLLKYVAQRSVPYLLFAGVALGLLALFKHNIGAYALAGVLCFILITKGARKGIKSAVALTAGFLAVIAPVLLYMERAGALAPMARALFLGPGEFLANRLAIPRSPVTPLIFILAMIAFAYAAYRMRSRPSVAGTVWVVLILLLAVSLVVGEEPMVNKLVFYVPIFLLIAGFGGVGLNAGFPSQERQALFLTGIAAASAFLELFPRLAREQSIAAMPFVILFAMQLLYLCSPLIDRLAGGGVNARLALAVLPALFILIGLRLFVSTYFDSHLRFVSNTQLKSERGAGIYFPEAVARTADQVVDYIQRRVPPDEYVFAQSNAGSPYLFLAGRKNPSSAQFWGGVGVTDSERAATLDELERRQVKLAITTDEALAGERYPPLREYISQNFRSAQRFDKVLILSR